VLAGSAEPVDRGRIRRRGRVGVDAEVLDHAVLELLDAQALLGTGHLIAMHRVGEAFHLSAQLAQVRTD